ncbi:MAG: histidine phosphatase family protein [Bryobacteraceae bacterium]
MSSFLLIRHGLTDTAGKKATGRLGGFRLNEAGRRQARTLAGRLADSRIAAVISSPLERTQETAGAIAERHGLAVETNAAFHEFDSGEWAGSEFDRLRDTPEWKAFTKFRSTLRAPGGESLLDAQYRAVAEMERIRARALVGAVAIVTHADVIRAVLAHYLAIPLDLSFRFEISPASVTVLEVNTWGPTLRVLNETGAIPLPKK